jgi:hypothetical protein
VSGHDCQHILANGFCLFRFVKKPVKFHFSEGRFHSIRRNGFEFQFHVDLPQSSCSGFFCASDLPDQPKHGIVKVVYNPLL